MRRSHPVATATLVCLGLVASAHADDSLRFDLGVAGGETGSGWNDVTDPFSTGVLISDARTSDGTRTAVYYAHRTSFAGSDKQGYQGFSPYPCDAMYDSFTLSAVGKSKALVEIGGLDPAHRYDLRFFGSHIGMRRRHRTEITVGARSATLGVGGNHTTRIGFEAVRPDLGGVISIEVRCPEGARSAALGVVELSGTFPAADKPITFEAAPVVTAPAWAIVDGETGDLLGGANADEVRPLGELEALMTGWIVYRLALDENSLPRERVTVSKAAAAAGGVGLAEGDVAKVDDLVRAVLYRAAPDATFALAEHLSGRFLLVEKAKESKQEALASRANFLAEMARTADELGMTRSVFPGAGKPAVTTARDQLTLAWYAMGNRRFREAVVAAKHAFAVTGKDGAKRDIEVANTNELLAGNRFDGVVAAAGKAGPCLVASGRRGKDRLVAVVLGSESTEARMSDVTKLMNWAWVRRGHKPGGVGAK